MFIITSFHSSHLKGEIIGIFDDHEKAVNFLVNAFIGDYSSVSKEKIPSIYNIIKKVVGEGSLLTFSDMLYYFSEDIDKEEISNHPEIEDELSGIKFALNYICEENSTTHSIYRIIERSEYIPSEDLPRKVYTNTEGEENEVTPKKGEDSEEEGCEDSEEEGCEDSEEEETCEEPEEEAKENNDEENKPAVEKLYIQNIKRLLSEYEYPNIDKAISRLASAYRSQPTMYLDYIEKLSRKVAFSTTALHNFTYAKNEASPCSKFINKIIEVAKENNDDAWSLIQNVICNIKVLNQVKNLSEYLPANNEKP